MTEISTIVAVGGFTASETTEGVVLTDVAGKRQAPAELVERFRDAMAQSSVGQQNKIVFQQAIPLPVQANAFPAEANAFPAEAKAFPAEAKAFPAEAKAFPAEAKAFPAEAKVSAPVLFQGMPVVTPEILPLSEEAMQTGMLSETFFQPPAADNTADRNVSILAPATAPIETASASAVSAEIPEGMKDLAARPCPDALSAIVERAESGQAMASSALISMASASVSAEIPEGMKDLAARPCPDALSAIVERAESGQAMASSALISMASASVSAEIPEGMKNLAGQPQLDAASALAARPELGQAMASSAFISMVSASVSAEIPEGMKNLAGQPQLGAASALAARAEPGQAMASSAFISMASASVSAEIPEGMKDLAVQPLLGAAAASAQEPGQAVVSSTIISEVPGAVVPVVSEESVVVPDAVSGMPSPVVVSAESAVMSVPFGVPAAGSAEGEGGTVMQPGAFASGGRSFLTKDSVTTVGSADAKVTVDSEVVSAGISQNVSGKETLAKSTKSVSTVENFKKANGVMAEEEIPDAFPATPQVALPAAPLGGMPDIATVVLPSGAAAGAVAAASARTQNLVEVAEQVCDAILVSPGLVKGEGEIRLQLKTDVLDGTEIRIEVKSSALAVSFQPVTSEAQYLLERHVSQFEQHLAGRIHNYQISVSVRRSKQNERA